MIFSVCSTTYKETLDSFQEQIGSLKKQLITLERTSTDAGEKTQKLSNKLQEINKIIDSLKLISKPFSDLEELFKEEIKHDANDLYKDFQLKIDVNELETDLLGFEMRVLYETSSVVSKLFKILEEQLRIISTINQSLFQNDFDEIQKHTDIFRKVILNKKQNNRELLHEEKFFLNPRTEINFEENDNKIIEFFSCDTESCSKIYIENLIKFRYEIGKIAFEVLKLTYHICEDTDCKCQKLNRTCDEQQSSLKQQLPKIFKFFKISSDIEKIANEINNHNTGLKNFEDLSRDKFSPEKHESLTEVLKLINSIKTKEQIFLVKILDIFYFFQKNFDYEELLNLMEDYQREKETNFESYRMFYKSGFSVPKSLSDKIGDHSITTRNSSKQKVSTAKNEFKQEERIATTLKNDESQRVQELFLTQGAEEKTKNQYKIVQSVYNPISNNDKDQLDNYILQVKIPDKPRRRVSFSAELATIFNDDLVKKKTVLKNPSEHEGIFAKPAVDQINNSILEENKQEENKLKESLCEKLIEILLEILNKIITNRFFEFKSLLTLMISAYKNDIISFDIENLKIENTLQRDYFKTFQDQPIQKYLTGLLNERISLQKVAAEENSSEIQFSNSFEMKSKSSNSKSSNSKSSNSKSSSSKNNKEKVTNIESLRDLLKNENEQTISQLLYAISIGQLSHNTFKKPKIRVPRLNLGKIQQEDSIVTTNSITDYSEQINKLLSNVLVNQGKIKKILNGKNNYLNFEQISTIEENLQSYKANLDIVKNILKEAETTLEQKDIQEFQQLINQFSNNLDEINNKKTELLEKTEEKIYSNLLEEAGDFPINPEEKFFNNNKDRFKNRKIKPNNPNVHKKKQTFTKK